jgi:hypothetical protein
MDVTYTAALLARSGYQLQSPLYWKVRLLSQTTSLGNVMAENALQIIPMKSNVRNDVSLDDETIISYCMESTVLVKVRFYEALV